MIKETKNEETTLFCHIFIIVGIFIGEGEPPGFSDFTYDYNFNGICDIKILFSLLVVCTCVHVKATLMVLFCMIMLNM